MNAVHERICFYNDSAHGIESRFYGRSYVENHRNEDVLDRAYDGVADRPKSRSEKSGGTGYGSDPPTSSQRQESVYLLPESDADPGAPT